MIGVYRPYEQVDYREDILGNKDLTSAVDKLLSKFGRRWE